MEWSGVCQQFLQLTCFCHFVKFFEGNVQVKMYALLPLIKGLAEVRRRFIPASIDKLGGCKHEMTQLRMQLSRLLLFETVGVKNTQPFSKVFNSKFQREAHGNPIGLFI